MVFIVFYLLKTVKGRTKAASDSVTAAPSPRSPPPGTSDTLDPLEPRDKSKSPKPKKREKSVRQESMGFGFISGNTATDNESKPGLHKVS